MSADLGDYITNLGARFGKEVTIIIARPELYLVVSRRQFLACDLHLTK